MKRGLIIGVVVMLTIASLVGCGTRPSESNLGGPSTTEVTERDVSQWSSTLNDNDDFTDQMATLALLVKNSNLSIRSLVKSNRFKASCYENNFQKCNFSWEK